MLGLTRKFYSHWDEVEFDLDRILTKDIVPNLYDMKDNQYVFWDAFLYSSLNKTPIKSILELGVMRITSPSKNKDYPGQSTKIFMALSHAFDVATYISLDINHECEKTIDRCKEWMSARGLSVTNHKFVIYNSIEFDVKRYFPEGIDLIFLDTSHDASYPEALGHQNAGGPGMTYKEICYYAPHLSSNGRLFLHDTKQHFAEIRYGVNVDGAIQRFLDENSEFDFYEHNTNKEGLGEIFRKDSNVALQYKDGYEN